MNKELEEYLSEAKYGYRQISKKIILDYYDTSYKNNFRYIRKVSRRKGHDLYLLDMEEGYCRSIFCVNDVPFFFSGGHHVSLLGFLSDDFSYLRVYRTNFKQKDCYHSPRLSKFVFKNIDIIKEKYGNFSFNISNFNRIVF